MKIKHPQGGRMYVPQYHEALEKARTVGELVDAAIRVASDMAGAHNNLKPELWAKIQKAKKCSDPL